MSYHFLEVSSPNALLKVRDKQIYLNLKDDGFLMLQWSVYARPCVSFARQKTHLERVVTEVPEEGNVRCIFITQAQWERSHISHGQPCSRQLAEGLPEQLQLW